MACKQKISLQQMGVRKEGRGGERKELKIVHDSQWRSHPMSASAILVSQDTMAGTRSWATSTLSLFSE